MANKKNAPANTVEETEGWRPEAGDVLTGTVDAVSKAWSDWSNSFYPLLTIKTDDGKLVDVHAFHATLQSRLMELKPKVGDALEIVYIGKRPTKDGKREVAVYKVKAPDATGEEVWGDLSTQDARAARSARPTSDVPPDMDGLTPNVGDDDIPF